jgi:hypothetical protein
MNLYTFTSKNLTNIWAGIGAGMWAVSKAQSENVRGIQRKAAEMLVGSMGILYCSQNRSFTTPFIVYSQPANVTIVSDVWPEEWALPFKIHPLGTPRKRLPRTEARKILPILQGQEDVWDFVFHIQGATAFVPTTISPEDWKIFVERLSE